MMNCEESSGLIEALSDGELDASGAARLAAHLAECEQCRLAQQRLAGLKNAIKAQSLQYVAPPHLRANIRAALQQESAKRKKPFKLPQFSWAWLGAGLAGGGTLAFALMLSLYVTRPSELDLLEQDIVSGHARSLMVNHLADVASTDQHTVKPWFSDKLDFAPNVVDFSAQGYPLVGGRLDYIAQHNVAALVYRHRLHTLNLFEWPQRGGAAVAPVSVTREGYQLMHWTQSGMNYWLISDMNAQDLDEFKKLVVAKAESGEQR